MIVKIHSTPNGKMIALCDSDILGKVFEEGERQLDLSANFYKGEEKSDADIERLLLDCYVVNAVGKDSIAFLSSKKLIDPDNVQEIAGVPYAQCIIER